MFLLGIDLGTSFIKVTVIDAQTQGMVSQVQYPEQEMPIHSSKLGWAEQDPENWWIQVQKAILKSHELGHYNPKEIISIGIAYQMHGLVLVDENLNSIRPSIIWCDSRSVEIGNQAFESLGKDYCYQHLLNSPGNFTASKLSWVKIHEPDLYQKIKYVLLPGDYISAKLTGNCTLTPSGLSEGILWDFDQGRISQALLDYFGFESSLFPKLQPVFSNHGEVRSDIAEKMGLKPGIPITYKAGDQLNNALGLGVMEPGEAAATAGTSGVIYQVEKNRIYDPKSRINTFAHVNHQENDPRFGILLCINGTGILYQWAKKILGRELNYSEMNEMGELIPLGSEGLRIIPFGNGSERILENKIIGCSWNQIDFNRHERGHIFRAIQEGIACAFRFGIELMSENQMETKLIKAQKSNLFLSPLFRESFANFCQIPLEILPGEGGMGAAIGAGIGLNLYSEKNPIQNLIPREIIEPKTSKIYEDIYQNWKSFIPK